MKPPLLPDQLRQFAQQFTGEDRAMLLYAANEIERLRADLITGPVPYVCPQTGQPCRMSHVPGSDADVYRCDDCHRYSRAGNRI